MADDTTRYLCAASYLDPAYGKRAIKEFLVEPTRPVPPSTGVDAGRVLTEAVRARARRKNFDGLLVILMAVAIGLMWDNPLLYGWIVLSLLLLGVRAGRKVSATEKAVNPKTMIVLGVAIVVAWLLLSYSDEIFGSGSRYSSRYYDDDYYYDRDSGGDTARAVIGIVLAAVVLVVVTIERWSLWNLLTTRFRRLSPPADGGGSLTGLFTEDFRAQLARYQQGDDGGADVPGAPLVVYRGYNPFVGAGFRRDGWSMAIPLERVDDADAGSAELTTEALYEGIREAIANLRHASRLSPDHRLGGLTVTEAVYTPASELVDHLAEPEAATYLPDVEHPPHTRLTPTAVARLRTEPKEWARYYLCFQVETWDRDLVLTTFLHAAVDDTTLYVEWTPFMLPPIRAEYRVVDKMRPDSLRPLGQGFVAWLEMPASLPGRILNLASWIREPKREPGVLDPDRYGAASTLRELASVNLFTDYFQLVDIERYEKILESRLLPSIGKLLGDAGYSTAKFEEQAAVVINNDITIGGDNRAPITQTGLRGGRPRPPAAPGRPSRTEA